MCYRYGKINHGSTYAGQKTIDMQVDVYGSGEFAWHFYIEKNNALCVLFLYTKSLTLCITFYYPKKLHFSSRLYIYNLCFSPNT